MEVIRVEDREVFFPSAAVAAPGSRNDPPTAAETTRNSRRVTLPCSRSVTTFSSSPAMVGRLTYFEVSWSFSMTLSRLKEAAFWRCGYSLKVIRN